MTSYVRYKPANIFFALVRLWAVRLSKNELDTIFSNTVGANIKDSTTTIHIEKGQEHFSAEKLTTNSKNENSWRAYHQRAWPLIRPNFVRLTCSQYKYALTLRGRNSRGAAQATIYQGFEKAVTGVTGKTVLLHRPTAIAHRAPRHRPIHRLCLPDLDHFHLDLIFHQSNQDQCPPSICKNSHCIQRILQIH